MEAEICGDKPSTFSSPVLFVIFVCFKLQRGGNMIVSRDHKRMGRSFDEDDDNDDEDDVEELERKIKYSIPVVYLIYFCM